MAQLGTATTPVPRPDAPRSGRLAVWDVDRTLTRSDTLLPFLRAVSGPRAWARAVPLVAADVVRHGGGRAELKDVLLQRCLSGRPQAVVEEIAGRYARGVLASGCRPDALERWAWHQARGDTLALASASLGLYLRPLGDLLGAHHVLATELEVDAGHLTGARSTPNCRGAQKARRVADLMAALRPETVWVYSDSRSDQPSLDLADVAVRVHAIRRLTTPPEPDSAPRTAASTSRTSP